MRLCVVGDTHGALVRMYEIVDELEQRGGAPIDAVLQVGDFGVWPDPTRLDVATQRHGDAGEFRALLAAGRVPRPTYFIAGNHEDFAYLQAGEPLPDQLAFIPWGAAIDVGPLRIGGIGGCYGPRDYTRTFVSGSKRRHYTAGDIAKLVDDARERPIDILLLHEPPGGVATAAFAIGTGPLRTWTLHGEGLAEAIAAIQPRICFTGHIHARTERRIAGVRTAGLAKVPYRGCALVIDVPERGDIVDVVEAGGPIVASDVVSDEDIAYDDPAEIEALAGNLAAWASAILGGRPLDRDARKRLHTALAASPHRAALMGVLLGRDPVEVIEQDIPAPERQRVELPVIAHVRAALR